MIKCIKIIIFAGLFAVLAWGGADIVLAADNSDLGMGYGNETGLSDTDPRIMVANIIRVILGFLGVLALSLIVYAGFLWMNSAGNPEKIEKAKNIIKAAVIGLIIILASFGIATFLINSILSSTDSTNVNNDGPDDNIDDPSPDDPDSCDGNDLTPTCEADHSMCGSDEFCESSSCTCQPKGEPGDECSASSTTCIPEDIQCLSEECKDDCICADNPIINSVSPVGGFCEEDVDQPCQDDNDCDSGGCDNSTPNGAPGNLVTVRGDYFGTTTGELNFIGSGGSSQADLASTVNPDCEGDWTQTQIVAVVPDGLAATSAIEVKRDDDRSDTTDNAVGPAVPDFVSNDIERPGLCRLSTTSAHMHDSVDYYGLELDNGEAYFGNYNDPISAYSSDFSNPSGLEGEAKIPSIEPGTTTTFVDKEVYSNSLRFVKLEEPYTGPYISSFSPEEGPAGEYVTIRGGNFGETRGNNKVYFGDTDSGYEADYDFPQVCEDSVWTDDQVVVKVPSSASDGEYIITMEVGGEVIDTSKLSSNKFDIDNSLPITPNLCKMQPIMGPHESEVSLWGEDFGDTEDIVRFYENVDQTDFGFWGEDEDYDDDSQRIDTTVPVSARTGPVAVVSGGEEGNSMDFEVGKCTEASDPDEACGATQICCPEGTTEEGRCKNSSDECYMDIPSSVYEWEFDSDFGTSSESEDEFDSCKGRSEELGFCESDLMCPNSPGQCSINPGGNTSMVIEDGCTSAYCNSEVGECGSGGVDCDYNENLNRCSYLAGSGSEVECDLSQEEELEFNDETQTHIKECVEHNGVGHWQIETEKSCPEGWTNIGDNKCLDSISSTDSTCDTCENGDCFDDGDGDDIGVCASEDTVCPSDAECDDGDCVDVESGACECCCRIGDNPDTGDPYAQQDCCSFLHPVSEEVESLSCDGSCGSDAVGSDSDTYGYCSGCRIEDEDGNVDQEASNEACNCPGITGKYCDVGADPDEDGDPEGACKDCATIDSADVCSEHSSVCCVDAQSDNACRGGAGDDSMVDGNLAYCPYYQCDDSNNICDIPNPVPSSTQETYTSTTTCQEECSEDTPSGLGQSCEAVVSTTTCYTSICDSPFECLTDTGASASYPDCGYCCCTPGAGDCDSLGEGLNCQADQDPCTGDDRGLCCGCSEDGDCGDVNNIGCGSDTCCRERPQVASTTPTDGEDNICSNALITAEFDTQMDTGSFSGNVIVVGEYSGSCPEGTEYIASADEVREEGDLLTRLWHGFKQKMFSAWRTVAGLFTDRAVASPPPSPGNNYCAVSGSTSGEQLVDGTTRLIFEPNEILDTDRKYFVIIKGDEDLDSSSGVRSRWDIGMNASDISPVDSDSSFNGITYSNSYIWSFTTLEDQGSDGVCEIDHVDINPSSYLFRTNQNSLEENDSDPDDPTFDTVSRNGHDRDKVFRAVAETEDSQSLNPVSGIYDWEWNWSIDNDQIVDFSPLGAPFPAEGDRRLVAAQGDITDGETRVRAEVNMIDNTTGYGGDGEEGVSDVWVFLCNNPWPPFRSDGTWYPWRDNIQGIADCVEGSCPPMNYEVYYCRDSGQEGVTADDLPAILSDSINRGSTISGEDMIKESYFFREALPSVESLSLTAVGTSTSWTEGGVVGLNWDAVSTPPEEELREYKIYYDTDSGTPYSESVTVPSSSAPYNTGDMYEVDGLTNGRTYYFSLTAVYDSGAESEYASEVSATPEDVVPPQTPQDMALDAVDDATVEVTWTPNTDDTTEYKIYWGHESGTYGEEKIVEGQESDSTQFEVENPDSEYYVTISAIDEYENESAQASEQNIDLGD